MDDELCHVVWNTIVDSKSLNYYICVNTEEFKFLNLNIQIISQLTFFCQEISFVFMIKSELIFSKRLTEISFEPISVSLITKWLGFDFQNFTSSQ